MVDHRHRAGVPRNARQRRDAGGGEGETSGDLEIGHIRTGSDG
jgi:hypothetical protein